MPGGKDNYLDDNGINEIRHLTLVFLGHMHRVELIAKFGTGKFFFPSSSSQLEVVSIYSTALIRILS